MLGIVIDENQPAYERGDFLVRPILGADPDSGGLAVGERVRSGRRCACTSATARRPTRTFARRCRRSRGARRRGAGGRAALHLQRPRLAHVRRPRPRRDRDRGRARRARRAASSAPVRSGRSAGATSCTASPRRSRSFRAPAEWPPTRRAPSSSGWSPARLPRTSASGDITSESVVAPGATARARILQKQPGVVFGLDAAAEVFRQAGAARVRALLEEGRWTDSVPVEVAAVAGPGRRAARRRAHGAQPARPPLRDRDPDGALRRRGRRHRGGDPRHPQDDAGPAGAGEGRRWRPAAGATTAWVSTTRS